MSSYPPSTTIPASASDRPDFDSRVEVLAEVILGRPACEPRWQTDSLYDPESLYDSVAGVGWEEPKEWYL